MIGFIFPQPKKRELGGVNNEIEVLQLESLN